MWKRQNWRSALEDGLRARRADAPADLVEGIARRILAQPFSPRRSWSRLAFAGAVSVFILGSFASFGGLSYAASGVDGTVAAVKQIVVAHKLAVTVPESSATSQYPHTPSKPATPHKPFTPPPHATKIPAVTAVSGKTLPFTGISLLGTSVLSLLLVGAGVALRRRERRN